jgi:hypothetical protein
MSILLAWMCFSTALEHLLSITFSAGYYLQAQSFANTSEKAAINKELVQDGIGRMMIVLML